MATELSHESSILIVGGGTWGCSTALHLARRGYKSVKVLDPYPVPSPISAGNDVNKIMELASFVDEADPEDNVSGKLLQAAYDGWLNDPVFKKHFHETGLIIAATTPEAQEHMYKDNGNPGESRDWTPLNTKEEFQATMPKNVLTGDFPGWKGFWRKQGAGWVHARKSMEDAANEAERLGVSFISGEGKGKVTSLLYEDGDVKGAISTDGTKYRADRTILAAGACAPEIFPMHHQLRPTAWTLAHIKMADEEVQMYKNLPVLFNVERGFFMEPDEDNNELKICDEHPGYCNWTEEGVSLPFARHQVPQEAEMRVRSFLRETMPQLADRPFSFARMCWCADTPNRAFLISHHPDYASLVLAVGGSGHGFCHIPAIGGFIVDAMEDKLDPEMKETFRWRPETASKRNWQDLQGRFGPDGSNRVMDLRTVNDWTTLEVRA